jgi:g-D-glutamyl-meso-diaminopimelate peptidase
MGFKIDAEFLLKADSYGREKMREHLLAKHPGINGSIVGRSILSRPIEAYFIGRGRRYVFLVAAHHALESITVNFSFAFMDYLMSKSQFGAINGVDCKLLLSKYCFVVVPCVNPDGIELRMNGAGNTPLTERLMRMSGGDFSFWQANARGVDLNHNYNYGFSEYKRIEAAESIGAGRSLYSGEEPESEPETRGVANLVRTLMPFSLVSLHTQGEEIYAYPDTARVKRCAERLAKITGYRTASPTGTAAYGGLSDYASSLGIPSFTLELGKGENPLDESMLGGIFPKVADAIAFLPTLL